MEDGRGAAELGGRGESGGRGHKGSDDGNLVLQWVMCAQTWNRDGISSVLMNVNEYNAPIQPTSLLGIGSVSKTFQAAHSFGLMVHSKIMEMVTRQSTSEKRGIDAFIPKIVQRRSSIESTGNGDTREESTRP